MKKEKIMIFEKPIVTIQKFELSIPNQKGRITCIRKHIQRQAHNTACDVADESVHYEIYCEVDTDTTTKVIDAVENMIKKGENK